MFGTTIERLYDGYIDKQVERHVVWLAKESNEIIRNTAYHWRLTGWQLASSLLYVSRRHCSTCGGTAHLR